MRLALVLLSVIGAAHAMKVGNTFVKSRANELDDEIGLNCDTASAHNCWATGSAGPCGPGMVAAAPAARKAVASLLRGGSFAGDSEEAAVPTPPDATSSAEAPAAGAGGLQSAAPSSTSSQGGERAKEQLTLSPERLAQIGRLSDVLTPISEELAMVPAFTVTVGNTSAPLTIPHGDGERLAYFFVEYMDAELFKRRLQERSPEVQLQVAALSLAQVIAAYSSDEVKGAEARERFVLIPTMSAVSDALELMPEPPPPERLSAASGLVPVFHVPSLLAQSASGKQRKILFFRKSDALNMYKNISLTQGDPEMPIEPERILVSDLHTVAASLVATNSTDDVIFAPSSTALRVFRGSATRESEQANSQGVGRNQQPSSIADYDDASLGLSEDEDDMDDEDAML